MYKKGDLYFPPPNGRGVPGEIIDVHKDETCWILTVSHSNNFKWHREFRVPFVETEVVEDDTSLKQLERDRELRNLPEKY